MLIKIGDYWVRPDKVTGIEPSHWQCRDGSGLGAIVYVEGGYGDVTSSTGPRGIGVLNETPAQIQQRVNGDAPPVLCTNLPPGAVYLTDDGRDYRTWIQRLRDWWARAN